MTRHLALFLLAATTPLSAAGLPRSFTVTSFDRIRIEGPYAVTLVVGRSSFGRATGRSVDLDAIDLRVEGRTLILRQRANQGARESGEPVRIALGTPDLRSASLSGSGSLAIDRLRGLDVELRLSGPGSLSVADLDADRVAASVNGSGALRLAGRAKIATLAARGSASLDAERLLSDEATIAAEGSSEASVFARSRATVTASGPVQVRLAGNPACVLKSSGSASVTGCRAARR
ncbi:hypothetical protein GCM10022280_00730 [Sphingomonas swuensis]|uniref:Putative auto-transporter adhesin head GIN domain-containing protein n=1 Tax=Sphingomonas swuensis TaxID=977800 RepID=A0ABP7S868_9SPHN